MFSTFKGAARRALAVSIFSVLGLTASAQFIRLGTSVTDPAAPLPPGSTCMATSTTVQQLFLDAAGTTIINTTINWTAVGGTLTLLSPDRRSVTFTSNTLAKSRVTVTYVRESGTVTVFPGTCPGGGSPICGSAPVTGSLTADFFKKFSIGDLVVGPNCAPGGAQVTYSINPVVSSNTIIQQAAGIDTYVWTTSPPVAFTYASGDQSSITFAMPINSDVTVGVRVGQCNTVALWPTINGNTGGAKTTRVAVAPVLSGIPACIASNSNAPITVSFSAALNTTYKFVIPSTWQITPQAANNNGGAGMSYASAGNQTVTITPDGNTTPATAGSIQVIATSAACNSVIGTPVIVNRSLVTTINVTPAPLTGNSYVKAIAGTGGYPNAAGVTYTFSLALAPPAGSAPFWAVPTGWVINTGQGTATITATPGVSAIADNITVATGGCVAATSLAVGVTTNTAATCNAYTAFGFPCAGVGVSPPASPCDNTGATYSFELFDSTTPGAVKGTAGPITHPTTSTNIANSTSSTIPSAVVRVRVRKGNYEQLFLSPVFNFFTCRPAPPQPPGPGPSKGDDQPVQLRAYPNPTGGVLNVDLTELQAKEAAHLTLLDLTGRVVLIVTTEKAHSTLNVSKLPTGTYTLRAELPGGQSRSQVVQVQH